LSVPEAIIYATGRDAGHTVNRGNRLKCQTQRGETRLKINLLLELCRKRGNNRMGGRAREEIKR
jgi:hypothetical protein